MHPKGLPSLVLGFNWLNVQIRKWIKLFEENVLWSSHEQFLFITFMIFSLLNYIHLHASVCSKTSNVYFWDVLSTFPFKFSTFLFRQRQSTSEHDIVLLQEVWTSTDFEMIRPLVRDAFPFSHFFNSGIIGSGTCIFTRVQLQDANFHEFAMNGYPTSVWSWMGKYLHSDFHKFYHLLIRIRIADCMFSDTGITAVPSIRSNYFKSTPWFFIL